MLLSAVSVLVVAQSSSEIPEGLTNNPVFAWKKPAFSLQKGVMDLQHIDPQFTREPVTSSLGCSHSTFALSASVKEADDAFAGFSYAPPIDLE